MRIGTRDILGREPVREVTRELADVAEAIVTQVARDQWLRTVEGRLRLIHNRSVGELPEHPAELERLARRRNYEAAEPARSVAAFLADAADISQNTRALFERIVAAAAQPCGPGD